MAPPKLLRVLLALSKVEQPDRTEAANTVAHSTAQRLDDRADTERVGGVGCKAVGNNITDKPNQNRKQKGKPMKLRQTIGTIVALRSVQTGRTTHP